MNTDFAGITLSPLPNDADIVIDGGKVTPAHFILKLFNKHKLTEANEFGEQGWVELICPHTGHKYRHIICCPNTFAITCRGCGKDIHC